MKSIGFAGQRIIEIPNGVREICRNTPLIKGLFITKMGVYPKARYHYYRRPKGISQVVVLYCTQGSGWVQLNAGRLILKEGDIFIIPSGIAHSYGASTKTPWTIYWLHISGTCCNEIVKAVMGNKAIPDKAEHIGVGGERIAIFERIEQGFLNGYSTTNLIYANLCLSYLISSFTAPNYFRQTEKVDEPATHVEKAIVYMQNNLSRPCGLSEIAASAHLSISFFSRHFKEKTGFTPIEYFNHLKIQKACELLHSSNLRINEISLKVGMEDPLYFSKLFKKSIGASPAKYRERETGVK